MFKKIIFLCLIAISLVSCIDMQETFMLENAKIRFVGDDLGLIYNISDYLITDTLTDVKSDKVKYIQENINNISIVVRIRVTNTNGNYYVYFSYFVDGVEIETNRDVVPWDIGLKIVKHKEIKNESSNIKTPEPKKDLPVEEEFKPTKIEKL